MLLNYHYDLPGPLQRDHTFVRSRHSNSNVAAVYFSSPRPVSERADDYRMGPPVDSVQLPNISGWILWFMVDISIVKSMVVDIMAYKP